MGNSMSSAVFGERLRVLRGNRTNEEIANLAGIQMQGYRRIEKAEIDRPAFEDIIAIGKAYELEPNEVAALAGLWVLPEEHSVDDELDRDLRVLRNRLFDLPKHERISLMRVFSDLVTVRKSHVGPRDDVDESVLPLWLRKRRGEHAANSLAASSHEDGEVGVEGADTEFIAGSLENLEPVATDPVMNLQVPLRTALGQP